MSRYTLSGDEPRHQVIVGWDNPLETFFLQVWDERDFAAAMLEGLDPPEVGRPPKEGGEEPEPIFSAGMKAGEVPTADALRALAGPFGGIPAEILVRLGEDAGRRGRPSASQLRLRR